MYKIRIITLEKHLLGQSVFIKYEVQIKFCWDYIFHLFSKGLMLKPVTPVHFYSSPTGFNRRVWWIQPKGIHQSSASPTEMYCHYLEKVLSGMHCKLSLLFQICTVCHLNLYWYPSASTVQLSFMSICDQIWLLFDICAFLEKRHLFDFFFFPPCLKVWNRLK